MIEHEYFQRLTDALQAAASDAEQIARLRNDRRWEHVAALLKQIRENVYQLDLVEQVRGLQ